MIIRSAQYLDNLDYATSLKLWLVRRWVFRWKRNCYCCIQWLRKTFPSFSTTIDSLIQGSQALGTHSTPALVHISHWVVLYGSFTLHCNQYYVRSPLLTFRCLEYCSPFYVAQNTSCMALCFYELASHWYSGWNGSESVQRMSIRKFTKTCICENIVGVEEVSVVLLRWDADFSSTTPGIYAGTLWVCWEIV